MKFHVDGSRADKTDIFVFGSNMGGQHLGGAAAAAHKLFGARWGDSIGRTGNAYAIPTLDESFNQMTIYDIRCKVEIFLEYARMNPDMNFFVTAIGCGIAGFTHEEIAPMFDYAPENCSLPDVWIPYVKTLENNNE